MVSGFDMMYFLFSVMKENSKNRQLRVFKEHLNYCYFFSFTDNFFFFFYYETCL